MLTLKQFKNKFGITELGFYHSTKSDRMVGSIGDTMYYTTVDFDATKPAFVYTVEQPDEETGELRLNYVISNTERRAFDLVL